jgi:hypothetical protein
LVVTDDQPGSPHQLALDGARTGWQPLSFDVGFVPVGTTVMKTIKFYNVSPSPIHIAASTPMSITPAQFSVDPGTCADQTILVRDLMSYCEATISFTPTASGPQLAAVLSVEDVNGVINQIIVKGTGILELGASPTNLAFGSVAVGSPSATKSVTLTNANGVAVPFTATPGDGDYSATNTCAGAVPAKVGPTSGTCTINITFTPTTAAPHPSALTIAGADYTPSVTLSGTGVAVAPPTPLPMQLSTTLMNFANVAAGATSTPMFLTLTNNNGSPIALTDLSFAGDFARNGGSCGGSVPANGSCTIGVSLTPTAAGALTGSLTITSAATGSPHIVQLRGSSTVPITVTPSIAFSYVPLGVSVVRTVTVTNSTPVATTVTGLTLSGYTPADFEIAANGCGVVPGPGSCTIDVRFTPLGQGSRSANLYVSSAGLVTKALTTLSGAGVTTANLNTSASGLAFGNLTAGSSSQLAFTVTNPNGVDVTGVTVSPSSSTDPYFSLSPGTTCGSTLAAGATCTVYVTFAPATVTSKYGVSGYIVVSWTGPAAGSPGVVLSGRGL